MQQKIGEQIAALRRAKALTQTELGERLGVTYQAVSKWERGEALPDIALLLPLAKALGTTTDYILNAGERTVPFAEKRSAKDICEGVQCIKRCGQLLGKQSMLYQSAVQGMAERMNTDVAAMLEDAYLFECLVAEAMIQTMQQGYFLDMQEVKSVLQYDKWYQVVCDYAQRCNLL